MVLSKLSVGKIWNGKLLSLILAVILQQSKLLINWLRPFPNVSSIMAAFLETKGKGRSAVEKRSAEVSTKRKKKKERKRKIVLFVPLNENNKSQVKAG